MRPTISLRSCCAAVLLGLVVLTGRDARADTFLMKDGARLHGWLAGEYRDENKQKWMSVRASFGKVDFQRKHLKKHLKSKRKGGPLLLDSARFVSVNGDVRKSADDGKTWVKVTMGGDVGSTSDDAPFPPLLLAGEMLRTGARSEAELDLGFGPAVVDAEAELRLHAEGEATLGVLRGRIGARLDDLPEDAEFRVVTPQASLGVRGTVFLVSVGDESRFGVLEGAIEVRVGADAVHSVATDELLHVTAAGSVTGDSFGDGERRFLVDVSQRETFPYLEWSYIPAGSFEIGGPDDPSEVGSGNLPTSPTKRVKLPAFLMARLELTVGRARRFDRWIGRHGTSAVHRRPEPLAEYLRRRPSWLEAPEDDEPVTMDFHRAEAVARWAGARLPSEAEWEYACRGGAKRTYGFPPYHTPEMDAYEWSIHNSGDKPYKREDTDALRSANAGPATSDPTAALAEAARCRPRPVGTLRSNPLGLHDMIGNVTEWCADAARPGYASMPDDGSAVAGGPEERRVVRGSAWNLAWWFRGTTRVPQPPVAPNGVRLVRDLR